MKKVVETNLVKLEAGDYGCPQCNGQSFTRTMHLDGVDFYQDNFSCDNCKTPVYVKKKRDRESQAYWGRN